MTTYARSVAGGRMADFLEGKTCISVVVLVASAACAVSALMVTLGAVHAHMAVVGKRHCSRACRKIELGRRSACLFLLSILFASHVNWSAARGLCLSHMAGHAVNCVFVFLVNL